MLELTPIEARVIGALIEKEITTPDQYPLSLNALMVACNQKSNRDPVMSLSLEEAQSIVDDLAKKNLVSEVVFGSRVAKYTHRFCNTEFSQYHFDPRELGVLCVMLLRGPQTAGELRTRTQRLCDFADATQVEATLEGLTISERGPFVRRLPREPGKREVRFAHCFYPEEGTVELESPEVSVNVQSGAETMDLKSRVTELEAQLAELRDTVDTLKAAWDEFAS